MTFSKTALVAVSLAALVAAAVRPRDSPRWIPAAGAADAGAVRNGDGKPTAAARRARHHRPGAVPDGTGEQPGRLAAAGGTAPAGAPDLTAASVAGVWNASVSGQSCKVATPQTKFGAGYRAGPLHCPAPIDGIKSWNVAGKQLTLYDENGGALARLYSSGGEKFDGQTSSGLPISLTR